MKYAIAIDFDGTLCTNDYPRIGKPNREIIYTAIQLQQHGAGLILWTCREGGYLTEAITACESWGLRFDAINESLPEWRAAWGSNPRKVAANEYWDDRAMPVIDGRFAVFRPNNGIKSAYDRRENPYEL